MGCRVVAGDRDRVQPAQRLRVEAVDEALAERLVPAVEHRQQVLERAVAVLEELVDLGGGVRPGLVVLLHLLHVLLGEADPREQRVDVGAVAEAGAVVAVRRDRRRQRELLAALPGLGAAALLERLEVRGDLRPAVAALGRGARAGAGVVGLPRRLGVVPPGVEGGQVLERGVVVARQLDQRFLGDVEAVLEALAAARHDAADRGHLGLDRGRGLAGPAVADLAGRGLDGGGLRSHVALGLAEELRDLAQHRRIEVEPEVSAHDCPFSPA